MDNRLAYIVPKGRESIFREIVNAIPSDWGYLEGNLWHPEELRRRGRIAENTGLYISRRCLTEEPIIMGRLEPAGPGEDHPRYHPPNLVDVFLRQKYPFDVVFDKAGFQPGHLTFRDAKEMAKEFILLGYTGFLAAYGSSQDEWDKRISIWQEGHRVLRRRSFGHESIRLPPNVELEWGPECGGREEHLDGLVYFLEQALGLERLEIETA